MQKTFMMMLKPKKSLEHKRLDSFQGKKGSE